MSKTIKFYEVNLGNTIFLESEHYVFEKDEVISIFKNHLTHGGNIFKLIENHEVISVEIPEDQRIKIFFWPDKSSDRYIMQITLPQGLEPILPKKLLSYLKEKEPTKFK